jgi:CHAT domain-containing protein
VTDVQRQLDKDTTLLSYFVGPDETLAFVITQNSFRAVRIWVKDKELIKEIAWFRAFPNLGNSPAAAPDLSVTLKQLYNQLIAPVRPYLKTRTVAIIPHRELHFLPFAALTDGLHYFGAQHTLFYLPSASALPYIKREVPGTRMFALAQSRASRYPRLYYADAEAKTVAGLYNTQPLTTGTTSKSEFLKQSADYSLIHIAAHARQDTVSPLFYGISLGADKDHTEKLEVREIYQLNLSQTSLVVLSACHSDWGIPTQGDDVIALDRAFLYAGASTVIASLWLVDDKSTSELMASFYKYLKNGMSKAEALRAAQSDTRRKHPDPFYWASFVLTGDPGR